MTDLPSPAPEQELLDRFLSPLGPPRWADLMPIVGSAKHAYFALHRSPYGDPTSAVTEIFPRLVQSLGVDSSPVRNEYVGRIRGKIDWGATIRSRCEADQNPQRFVCREAERHTDTPENQLIVWLLQRLRESLREVPPAIRTGSCRHGVAGERFVAVSMQIDALEAGLYRLTAHPRLRDVTVPFNLGEVHIDSAYRARHPGYELAAELCRKWHRLHQRLSRRALVDLGRFSVLVPGRGPDSPLWTDLAALLLANR